MSQDRTPTTYLMLLGVVILLMIANLGLFLRMNQLQGEVLKALEPLQSFARPQPLERGTRSPEFSLADIEGNEIRLQDFKGHRLLLLFSSVTCPACAEIWPHLNDLSARESNVQFLMISKGTEDENSEFIREFEFPFTVLQWKEEVVDEYQIPGTPFAYIIDERGMIAGSGYAGTVKDLQALLELQEHAEEKD